MGTARRLGKRVFAAVDRVLAAPKGPRVLIYHRVVDDPRLQMELALPDFVEQMEWLASNRVVVGLDAAVSAWRDADADRLVVLTFDDGYEDVYTTAFPVLRRLELPFLLYVSSGMIAEEAPVPGGQPQLTWSQIETMLDSGLMTLGAHTHSHPDLRGLDESAVESELDRSDRLLRERAGVEARHFAYPYGFWSSSADPVVRRRYETAVLGGSPRPSSDPDPYLIHRFPIQLSDDFGLFQARIEGGMRMEEAVRRIVKGYRGP